MKRKLTANVKVRVSLLMALAGISSVAWADGTLYSPSGYTPIYVGVGVYNTANFSVAEGPPSASTCLYSLFYIDISSTSGRALYATVLAAKQAGKKFTTIQWVTSGSNTAACWATSVMLMD